MRNGCVFPCIECLCVDCRTWETTSTAHAHRSTEAPSASSWCARATRRRAATTRRVRRTRAPPWASAASVRAPRGRGSGGPAGAQGALSPRGVLPHPDLRGEGVPRHGCVPAPPPPNFPKFALSASGRLFSQLEAFRKNSSASNHNGKHPSWDLDIGPFWGLLRDTRWRHLRPCSVRWI